jgi:hypothetical protein
MKPWSEEVVKRMTRRTNRMVATVATVATVAMEATVVACWVVRRLAPSE